VAFYARDERSKGFSCVIPRTDASTRVSIYPMAGRHATLVGNASLSGADNNGSLTEAGQLVRHFAEVCLTRWGSSITKKLDLTPAKVSLLHQSIVAHEDKFKAMTKHSYTKITEHKNNERLVSFGETGVNFSALENPKFSPPVGLAASLVKGNEAYKDIS